jgi:hypothetical protein
MATTRAGKLTTPSRASLWPQYPWVWLAEKCLKHRKNTTLSSMPSGEWDVVAACGFTALWFTGVCEGGRFGIAIACRNENLLDNFRRALRRTVIGVHHE